MKKMEGFLDNLLDHKVSMPTRLYHFVELDLIIKIPSLKEKLNSKTRIKNIDYTFKIYWTDEITTILWPQELKAFIEQLNVLKVDDDEINPIDNFADTTSEITIKNHHICGFPVYVFDERLKGNIYVLTKW